MPGGDRTGPQGMGVMTGRRAGYCTGNQLPGAANQQPISGGRGWGGCNFGRRRGNRNMFNATGQTGWQRADANIQAAANQSQPSGNQETVLRAEIDNLKQRLAELEK